MGDEAIRERVVDVFRRVVPEATGEEIDPEVAFRDQYEIDSLDYLNFVLSLEKELELPIPETDYPRLGSLSGAVAYLRSRRAEASS